MTKKITLFRRDPNSTNWPEIVLSWIDLLTNAYKVFLPWKGRLSSAAAGPREVGELEGKTLPSRVEGGGGGDAAAV